MARGNDQAQAGAGQGLTNATTAAGNAGELYSTLAPQLQTEIAHPAGYDPTSLAEMNTGAQQSAGGSEAAAVGEGALHDARTRNAGGADAAIASSARSAGQELSKNALGISTANARLKEQQRESGMSGLEGLTGLETNASNNALGEVAGDVNANTNAENASWDWAKDILSPVLQAAGASAGGYLSK